MSSNNAGSSVEDEHRRKRVRKGTRSCWECKRRKIKCQLSTENVPVCSGCLQRGTNCVSQEYPEEHEQSSGPQMGERLGRVELLLEKLLDKINSYDEKASLPTPESVVNDVLTPYSGSGSNVYENAPVLSLFDNVVIGRRDTGKSREAEQIATPPAKTPSTPSCRPVPKMDRMRITIAAQLPSQRDSDIICHASNCWLLIHGLAQTSSSDLLTRDRTLTSFDLQEVSKRHPTIIARTLLYIAVCMQQLPTMFDRSTLQIKDLHEAMDKYMSTATLVTSDDELVSTLEGLECLVLQGLFHVNAGNLRRAWLSFRRALNIGQLMGLHRGYAQSLTGRDNLKAPGGRRMWYQIVQADRYLALLLGMPCGSADDGFAPDENLQNPNVDLDQIFNRRMCNISGRIIERNQEDYANAFAKTQEIDESLERLAKEMPPGYWAIPKVMLNNHTVQEAQQFDRLMSQIWFFQLESLLHLPFMLRAATERRYEYSKFSCLKASREMLDRYLALRNSNNRSFCCKVVDFGAFTATVTVLLGLLIQSPTTETPLEKQQKENDRLLVNTVLLSMEELADSGDVVAAQSVDVIRALSGVNDQSGRNGGNLRLTIPYFGTISIIRASVNPGSNADASVSISQQPLQPGQNIGPQNWQALPFAPSTKASVVSFTSSQFPPFVPEPPIEDWNLQESDTLFFDSLLNTDIEGNWVF
ncbi:C6 zinc finger domain-containing protein [Phlyctema vagabunda]|uniref:C6 zinc finger domain-containing protein n=1 Tax=Phlyctema vagabunda TaxID=108571 RepID=A0ABR4PGX5_9HELO